MKLRMPACSVRSACLVLLLQFCTHYTVEAHEDKVQKLEPCRNGRNMTRIKCTLQSNESVRCTKNGHHPVYLYVWRLFAELELEIQF